MQKLAVLLATVGPVGRVPLAPGTLGSLVALPLVPSVASLRARSVLACALVVAAIVATAVWSAGRAEAALGGHDHSAIVIDEVAGLAVAGLLVPATWLAAVAAFALFRLFDVTKPFPAGAIDARVGGGLGVVGDDLVAGVYAGIATRLLLGLT